jgi:hypothetical protein
VQLQAASRLCVCCHCITADDSLASQRRLVATSAVAVLLRADLVQASQIAAVLLQGRCCSCV